MHFAMGGKAGDLADTAADQWDRRDRYAEAAESGWNRVRESATGATDALHELASALAESFHTARDEAATVAADGQVEVFFAPVRPLNPQGIDDRLVAFLTSAEESVYCAFYDLGLDTVADALIDRHQAAVDVRIVTDSDYADRRALRRCIEAGIPVVFDGRSAFMHNKFAVVDGVAVWTGSANITESGMFRNNNNALLIRAEPLALNYTTEFAELLSGQFGASSPRNTPYPEIVLGDVRIECYFAPEDGVRAEIIEELREARETIDFMAFAFTSNEIAEAMARRIRGGVRVRGLFETRNAGSEYARDDWLAAQGASIYLDANPGAMHHKVIIVDGRTVVTGSYNFSNNAEERNDENCLILHSPAIGARFTTEFESLIGG